MNVKRTVAMLLGALSWTVFATPVKVIFDTDMYTDIDDVGALACLHAMADAGECEILATVSCTRDCMSIAMCEIVNSYYGRPDIPVGCTKGMGVCHTNDPEGVARNERIYGPIVKRYAKDMKHPDSSDAPDALEVYRHVLSAQPDHSVVICSVGFLTNLRRLVESDRDLVARKVKRWVAMACRYPSGREYNSRTDAESSRIALENWPTPIVFSDFQYGIDCFAGRAVAESDLMDSPVVDVFRGNVGSFNGRGGRSAWDETAALIAVRGIEPLFDVERGTYRMVGDTGENVWIPDGENGPHLRVTEKTRKIEVGRIIDELICRGPKSGPFGADSAKCLELSGDRPGLAPVEGSVDADANSGTGIGGDGPRKTHVCLGFGRSRRIPLRKLSAELARRN